MRLFYNSILYKTIAVLRFLVVRIFYLRRFRCDTLSMVGSNCGIHISSKGSIHCAGRVIINDHVMLQTQKEGKIRIGKQFYTNRYTRIIAHESIEIGNNVTLGQMISILDHNHHYTFEGQNLQLKGYTTAAIKIGNNVWIGDKVSILKGVTIGDNVVIGANSLVHKDIPSNSVVGGVPFRVLKELKT